MVGRRPWEGVKHEMEDEGMLRFMWLMGRVRLTAADTQSENRKRTFALELPRIVLPIGDTSMSRGELRISKELGDSALATQPLTIPKTVELEVGRTQATLIVQ